MPTPTPKSTRPVLGLTDRGRLVALTYRLREQFDGLDPAGQAHVLAELERLVALYRQPVPLVGTIVA